ncbi:MAG: response regulator transcription factor [Rubrivivax sp.]
MNPSSGLPVVYIVDDEDVVRDALGWLLRSRRVLSEGLASAEAFEAAVQQRADAVRGHWPGAPGCLSVLPVNFLTGHGDVPTAVAAVKRGAFDFVEKPFSNNALVDRVEQALAASAQALLQRRQQRERALRPAELTESERDVMALVVEGRPNELIADALHISVRTVEVHRARIFEKMGVKSAVGLANRLRDHDGVAA